jgi:hypothetical protein
MPIIEKIKEKVMPQHNNAAEQPTATSTSSAASTTTQKAHMLMPGDRQHSNNLDDSQHHDSRKTGVTGGFGGRLKDAATGALMLRCATCIAVFVLHNPMLYRRFTCMLWQCSYSSIRLLEHTRIVSVLKRM